MKWISVEDRLPSDDYSVFIWPQVDFEEVEGRFTGSYYSSRFKQDNKEYEAGWYVQTSDGWADYKHLIKVTHWMPLFEPPTTRRE